MKRSAWMLGLGAAAALCAASSAAAAEEWHAFARNAATIYLAEVSALAEVDGVVTLRVARVKRARPGPGDYSYTVKEYGVRCAANQTHLAATAEYGPDGAESDRFAEDDPWEDVTPNSFDATVKGFACDNLRSPPPVYDSVKAFIDAGVS